MKSIKTTTMVKDMILSRKYESDLLSYNMEYYYDKNQRIENIESKFMYNGATEAELINEYYTYDDDKVSIVKTSNDEFVCKKEIKTMHINNAKFNFSSILDVTENNDFIEEDANTSVIIEDTVVTTNSDVVETMSYKVVSNKDDLPLYEVVVIDNKVKSITTYSYNGDTLMYTYQNIIYTDENAVNITEYENGKPSRYIRSTNGIKQENAYRYEDNIIYIDTYLDGKLYDAFSSEETIIKVD